MLVVGVFQDALLILSSLRAAVDLVSVIKAATTSPALSFVDVY